MPMAPITEQMSGLQSSMVWDFEMILYPYYTPLQMQGFNLHYQTDVLGQITPHVLGPYTLGDINEDGFINILDVVLLINYIVYTQEQLPGGPTFTEEQLLASDLKQDGFINILDVVGIINIMLEE